ncbi:MAG: peptidoglycan DD-metalloendopeptidase family protein [Chloroflexi bacterium]|nr:peptidoglycan DD-metalloendopeptidase family protein [Chloroflexota bacterium]
MSIAIRPAAPWVAAFLLLTVAAGPLMSQTIVRATDPTVDGAISEQLRMQAELQRQRTQLAELQREQTNLTASLISLSGDLTKVGLEIEQAARDIEQASQRLDQARAELQKYEAEIATLEQTLVELAGGIEVSKVELAERQALLQEHMRTAYEQSQTSVLEILLSTESFTKASNELSSMLSLSDEDRRLADEIRDKRTRLEVRSETLSVGRGTLTKLRDAAAARAQALAAQQLQLDAARAALDAKRKQLEEMRGAQEGQLAAVSQSVGSQAQLIAAQEQQLLAHQALVDRLKAAADRLDIAYRGRFDWPERGAFIVTQNFGPTIFNTFHTGLDMAYLNRCGGPIYAAGDGIVIADGRPNSKYGDVAIGVVIGHSQRLATLYWHLSREIVTVGQEVHVGDVIGYEGATGRATGCHLHFEVDFDGSAVNPRKYLP